MKADDRSLTKEEYALVRAEAEKVLKRADAFGVYPTPITHLIKCQDVEEISEDVLNVSFIEKYRQKAGQKLRKAVGKVLGLFDSTARLIFIDRSLMQVKQNFVRLHELGHSQMPWQRDLYRVVEDSKLSLDPDLADQFDREANVFASEVLFQLGGFSRDAAEYDFELNTPISLSKKYGASIYSTIRRYVKHNTKTCSVVVLNMPQFKEGDGFSCGFRRVISSDGFKDTFGSLNWGEAVTSDHILGNVIPFLGNVIPFSNRDGRQEKISLSDMNGDIHECIAESFTNTYQIFILIHSIATLSKSSIIVPNVDDIHDFSKNYPS